MSFPGGVRASRHTFFFLQISLFGLLPEGTAMCMMGIFYQNTLIKEISHGSPDPVSLTTRISYHREKRFIVDTLKRRFHDCGEGMVTEPEAAWSACVHTSDLS